jgi:hypothetical protein
VPSIYRGQTRISGEEFANVAGRAGRAYVDVHGLVVNVLFDPKPGKVKDLKKLLQAAKARSIESGLFTLVAEIAERLTDSGVVSRDDALQYF